MIEIIKDKEALAKIADEWNMLSEAYDTPLLSHDWFFSCASAFTEEGNLRVVVVRSDSEITAIAPLVVIRRGGFEYLEILGSSFLGEHSGILYRSEKSLRILLNGIFLIRRPFYLHRLSFDTPLTKLLSHKRPIRGIFIKRNTSGSPYVPINTTWDEFYGALSSKQRNNLKSRRKKAKKIGNCKLSIYNPKFKELKSNLKIAFDIEVSGWKGDRRSAILANQKLHDFFNTYLPKVCKKDVLRLGFLYINENPVAMVIGLECQNRFWLLKVGYDEKYSKCSPGILLIHETIRYAFDKGLESYEFLGSDEKWKRMWAKHNLRNYVSLGLYTANMHGLTALFFDLKRFGVQKLPGLYKRQR